MADREEVRKAAEKKLDSQVDAVLRTEEGRAVFAFLFHRAEYNGTAVAVDPSSHEILPLSSAYNAGRRSLYLDLRRRASYDLLQAAEALAERPTEEKE